MAKFIIGDAGGTGTQWKVAEDDNVITFQSTGYNAYSHNLSDFKKETKSKLHKILPWDGPVYLYAAGIDTSEQKEEVKKELSGIFGNMFVAENDLVGAARSLCGKKEGNVGILGTGANACYYNGEDVNKVSSSLGYVLGDEGSGAFLGKKLLINIFRDKFSKEIEDAFYSSFEITAHDVILKLYYQPQPNHFLASFAGFIGKHKSHPEIHDLVYSAFSEYFEAFFSNRGNLDLPFFFTGSIAFHFSDILKEAASDKGFFIEKISQSPLEGILSYHQLYG